MAIVNKFLLIPMGIGIAIFLLLGVPLALVQGQGVPNKVSYFPETGHYIQGDFLAFWQQNGGVTVFGYPITEQYQDHERGRTVQWFERARFELTMRAGIPYVELGMLGMEKSAGRTFPPVPPVPNTTDIRYFPQTQHVIQKGFKQIWEEYGGERIFGYPISEELLELFPSGEFRTVQYFERARFEYWQEMPPGERVLITRLGNELAPAALLTPLPVDSVPGTLPPGSGFQPVVSPTPIISPTSMPVSPPIPTSSPASPITPVSSTITLTKTNTPTPTTVAPTTLPVAIPQAMPAPRNADVEPKEGTPGTSFVFHAYGFQSNEPIGIWLTAPDQTTRESGLDVRADEDGMLVSVTITTKPSFADGIWSINAQGLKSNQQAVAYVHLSRAIAAPPGDPAKLGIILHSPEYVDSSSTAFMLPFAAPAGASLLMVARGYTPGENISGWITATSPSSAADGKSYPLHDPRVQTDEWGLAMIRFSSEELVPGAYVVVAKGESSGAQQSAHFILTNDYIAGPGTPRPANVHGRATPNEGEIGTTFAIRGENLYPNEDVVFWTTEPSGSYTLAPSSMVADDQGRIGYIPPIDVVVHLDMSPGVYGFHFQGKTSGQRVDVYFVYR